MDNDITVIVRRTLRYQINTLRSICSVVIVIIQNIFLAYILSISGSIWSGICSSPLSVQLIVVSIQGHFDSDEQ